MTESDDFPHANAALMHCAHCGWSVQEGPVGGYVCGQCFHTVEPQQHEPSERPV
ncbi:hypothetical protein [Streptomyces sp. ISL-11]|uniref:hypothetical protein n=1 Tax=Streptomyces sp. ISL-11 TaxID=2819174 RepID=UPI001BEBB599|nr:hypothetical protein [Streptomyces sp. ISL-11]MBT2383926.1 hypothetical protein [Streptomyces sp. ISL-11]